MVCSIASFQLFRRAGPKVNGTARRIGPYRAAPRLPPHPDPCGPMGPYGTPDRGIRPFRNGIAGRDSAIRVAPDGVGRRSKDQMACKPGSVSAFAKGRPQAWAGDGHSSRAAVAGRLVQPTRTTARKRSPRSPACRPYSVLLPVGFTLPPLSPGARCALTAPFHPYPPVCRSTQAGGLLSVALSLESPPPGVTRHRVSVEPGLSSPGAHAGGGHPAIWPWFDVRGRPRPRQGTPSCAGARLKAMSRPVEDRNVMIRICHALFPKRF